MANSEAKIAVRVNTGLATILALLVDLHHRKLAPCRYMD